MKQLSTVSGSLCNFVSLNQYFNMFTYTKQILHLWRRYKSSLTHLRGCGAMRRIVRRNKAPDFFSKQPFLHLGVALTYTTGWINIIVVSIKHSTFVLFWTQWYLNLLMTRVIKMFQMNLHLQGMQSDFHWNTLIRGEVSANFYFCCCLCFSFILEKGCIYLTLTCIET